MKRTLQIALAAVLGAGLGAGYLYANHPWICSGTTAYHWASPTVRYASAVEEKVGGAALGRSVSSYTSAFSGSVSVWNGTIINMTSGTDLRLYYDTYGNNGWLGLASIYPSGCVIGRATSKLNDSYLRDTSRYSQTSVNHVACQEVGHTYGLGHNQSSNTTCMNDRILTAGNQINQHDKDTLNAIY